ncbi:MAG: DHHA1 domain-containing protein [Patescibacteria group bacterium]
MPRLIKKRKATRVPKKNILVFYHKNCTDGFGAAWAAWKKFGKRAEYIPLDPREVPPWPIKNKTVYMLDNSFSPENLKKLLKENKKVMVIDHHSSSEKDIKTAPEYVFDLNHSGAVLAWKYFHPGKRIPKILLHAEDEDLWRFKLPNTKAIFAGIDSSDFEFKSWNNLAREIENPITRRDLVRRGAFVLNFQKNMVRQIAQNAEVVRFEGIKTLAVNSPVLESDIGHYLYEKLPPMGIVWRRRNGKITFSLRSNGKVDVAKLAGKYGGGGHAGSAGFAIKADKKLPWKMIRKSYER